MRIRKNDKDYRKLLYLLKESYTDFDDIRKNAKLTRSLKMKISYAQKRLDHDSDRLKDVQSTKLVKPRRLPKESNSKYKSRVKNIALYNNMSKYSKRIAIANSDDATVKFDKKGGYSVRSKHIKLIRVYVPTPIKLADDVEEKFLGALNIAKDSFKKITNVHIRAWGQDQKLEWHNKKNTKNSKGGYDDYLRTRITTDEHRRGFLSGLAIFFRKYADQLGDGGYTKNFNGFLFSGISK